MPLSSSVLALGFRGHHCEHMLAAAFSGFGELVRCDNAAEALARVSRQDPSLIVAPDHDAHDAVLLPLVERLREVVPSAPLLVVFGPYRGDARSARQFAQLGAQLVYARTAAELRAAGERAQAPETPRRALDEVIDAIRSCHAPVALRRFMEALAEDSGLGGGSVTDVARTLGLDRRTLARRSRHAGWPPPGELLDWIRLLSATTRQLSDWSTRRVHVHAAGPTTDRRLRAIALRLCRVELDLRSVLAQTVIVESFERRIRAPLACAILPGRP